MSYPFHVNCVDFAPVIFHLTNTTSLEIFGEVIILKYHINNETCYKQWDMLLVTQSSNYCYCKLKHIKELEIYPISISYLSTHQSVTRFGNWPGLEVKTIHYYCIRFVFIYLRLSAIYPKTKLLPYYSGYICIAIILFGGSGGIYSL